MPASLLMVSVQNGLFGEVVQGDCYYFPDELPLELRPVFDHQAFPPVAAAADRQRLIADWILSEAARRSVVRSATAIAGGASVFQFTDCQGDDGFYTYRNAPVCERPVVVHRYRTNPAIFWCRLHMPSRAPELSLFLVRDLPRDVSADLDRVPEMIRAARAEVREASDHLALGGRRKARRTVAAAKAYFSERVAEARGIVRNAIEWANRQSWGRDVDHARGKTLPSCKLYVLDRMAEPFWL